jgi:DNA-binding MarR family transcriptional regulator
MKLGHRQRAALEALERAGRPLGVREIAEAAGLGNAVMSRRYRVVDSLYRRGLIERVPDPRRDDWSLWQVRTGSGTDRGD